MKTYVKEETKDVVKAAKVSADRWQLVHEKDGRTTYLSDNKFNRRYKEKT